MRLKDLMWPVIILGGLWFLTRQGTDASKGIGLPGRVCPYCGATFGPLVGGSGSLEEHIAQVHGAGTVTPPTPAPAVDYGGSPGWTLPTSAPGTGYVLMRAYKGTQEGMLWWVPPEAIEAYLAGDWILA